MKTTRRRSNCRLIPLLNVSSLIECTIGALRILMIADFGPIVRATDSVSTGIAIHECRVVAWIDRISQSVARNGISSSRIVPVTRATRLIRIKISCLVPLVLGGYNPFRTCLPRHRHQCRLAGCTVEIVSAILGRRQTFGGR